MPTAKQGNSEARMLRLSIKRLTWLGANMKRFKIPWAIVLVLLSAGNSFAKSTSKRESDSRTAQISQECRQALVDAARWEAEAQLLGKQVEELKAQVAAGKAESDKLREAIAKYEAAAAAQDRADARVAELRLNYEKQLSNAEKQLAIEQGKTNFWRTFAKLGIGMGIVIGAAIGYAIGNQ